MRLALTMLILPALVLPNLACEPGQGLPGSSRRGAGSYASERSGSRQRELRADGTFWSRERGNEIRGLYFAVGDTLYFVPALGSAVLRGDTIIDQDGEEWVRQRPGQRAERARENDRESAYLAAMKSDLRNLVTAQESFFADNVTYTTSLSALNFIASTAVTVRVGSATGTGWNATARHAGTSQLCGIFVGSATAPMSGANEGEPKCR